MEMAPSWLVAPGPLALAPVVSKQCVWGGAEGGREAVLDVGEGTHNGAEDSVCPGQLVVPCVHSVCMLHTHKFKIAYP